MDLMPTECNYTYYPMDLLAILLGLAIAEELSKPEEKKKGFWGFFNSWRCTKLLILIILGIITFVFIYIIRKA